MSLGGRLFFWTPDWIAGAIPPTSADPALTAAITVAGSGKSKSKPRENAYFDRASQEYWDVREAFLRTIHNETLPPQPAPITKRTPTVEPPPSLRPTPRYDATLATQQAAAVAAVRYAKTKAELVAAGEQLQIVNRKITAAKISQILEQARVEREAPALRAERRKRRLELLQLAAEQFRNTVLKVGGNLS